MALNFSSPVTVGGNSTITQSDTAGATFGTGGISDGGNGFTLSIAGADATTFSGVIGGAVSLDFAGTGTATLSSGSNNYTGGTTINSGTLLANGNIPTATSTTVNSGGTLEGTGTVGAVVV